MSSKKEFFAGQLSFHSNNDLRTISVYGSPLHMRKHRNVYSECDKFWLLKNVPEKKEDPRTVSKISELQQQVNVFEPFMRRSTFSTKTKMPLVRISDEKMRKKKFGFKTYLLNPSYNVSSTRFHLN